MITKSQLIKCFNKSSHKSFSTSLEFISKNKDIGLITIKNSKKRNALSYDIICSVISEFEKIESQFKNNNYPRVTILSTEGPVFSSGHDLKELANSNEETRNKIFSLVGKMMMKIQASSSIVIAEVQGLATAAGCQLAATCDLIVASNKASFETPGVKIGLFCSSPAVAVARSISHKRAMQMLVTGLPVSAQTALDWGLVNEICDVGDAEEHSQREKLRAYTLELAEKINQYSGTTLSFGKKTFYEQVAQNNLECAYDLAGKAMCTNLGFKDTKEGISAFLEKRKPNFNKH